MSLLTSVCSFSTVPGAVYGVQSHDESTDVQPVNLVGVPPVLSRGVDIEVTSLYGVSLWLPIEQAFVSLFDSCVLRFVWHEQECDVELVGFVDGIWQFENVPLLSVGAILILGSSGLENHLAGQALREQSCIDAIRSRAH